MQINRMAKTQNVNLNVSRGQSFSAHDSMPLTARQQKSSAVARMIMPKTNPNQEQ